MRHSLRPGAHCCPAIDMLLGQDGFAGFAGQRLSIAHGICHAQERCRMGQRDAMEGAVFGVTIVAAGMAQGHAS